MVNTVSTENTIQYTSLLQHAKNLRTLPAVNFNSCIRSRIRANLNSNAPMTSMRYGVGYGTHLYESVRYNRELITELKTVGTLIRFGFAAYNEQRKANPRMRLLENTTYRSVDSSYTEIVRMWHVYMSALCWLVDEGYPSDAQGASRELELREKIEPAYFYAREHYTSRWERVPLVTMMVAAGVDPTQAQAMVTMVNTLHMLHVSQRDAKQIAYYPTVKHMREGREIRTTLGSYLSTYATLYDISQAQIKQIVDRYNAELMRTANWEVAFADHNDPDLWEQIYKDGPSSCMAGESAVRVYAHEHSVLRLAYLVAPATDEYGDDEILARCIVREDEKGYIRVYPVPNSSVEGRFLLTYLEANGYGRQVNLDGALLTYSEDKYSSGLICPYLDRGDGGCQTVSITYQHGRQYLLCGGGDIDADTTNGLINNGTICDCCGCTYDDQNEGAYVDSTDQNVCDSCIESDYTMAYDRYGYVQLFLRDDCIFCESDSQYYVEDSAGNPVNGVHQCEVSNDWYHNDDLSLTSRGWVCERLCVVLDYDDDDGNSRAYEDDVITLHDGQVCHVDDAVKHNDEYYHKSEELPDDETQSDMVSESEQA